MKSANLTLPPTSEQNGGTKAREYTPVCTHTQQQRHTVGFVYSKHQSTACIYDFNNQQCESFFFPFPVASLSSCLRQVKRSHCLPLAAINVSGSVTADDRVIKSQEQRTHGSVATQSWQTRCIGWVVNLKQMWVCEWNKWRLGHKYFRLLLERKKQSHGNIVPTCLSTYLYVHVCEDGCCSILSVD